MSKLRILKEYEDITKNPPFNCSAGYIDDFKIWAKLLEHHVNCILSK